MIKKRNVNEFPFSGLPRSAGYLANARATQSATARPWLALLSNTTSPSKTSGKEEKNKTNLEQVSRLQKGDLIFKFN
jgi:hypothetical protein